MPRSVSRVEITLPTGRTIVSFVPTATAVALIEHDVGHSVMNADYSHAHAAAFSMLQQAAAQSHIMQQQFLGFGNGVPVSGQIFMPKESRSQNYSRLSSSSTSPAYEVSSFPSVSNGKEHELKIEEHVKPASEVEASVSVQVDVSNQVQPNLEKKNVSEENLKESVKENRDSYLLVAKAAINDSSEDENKEKSAIVKKNFQKIDFSELKNIYSESKEAQDWADSIYNIIDSNDYWMFIADVGQKDCCPRPENVPATLKLKQIFELDDRFQISDDGMKVGLSIFDRRFVDGYYEDENSGNNDQISKFDYGGKEICGYVSYVTEDHFFLYFDAQKYRDIFKVTSTFLSNERAKGKKITSDSFIKDGVKMGKNLIVFRPKATNFKSDEVNLFKFFDKEYSEIFKLGKNARDVMVKFFVDIKSDGSSCRAYNLSRCS